MTSRESAMQMIDVVTDGARLWASGQMLAVAAALMLAAVRWFGLLWAAPLPGRAALSLRHCAAMALVLSVLVLPVTSAEGSRSLPQPGPLLIQLAGLEFLLGLLLGFGMRIVIAATRLAGELIDQQAGLAMAQVLNPALGEETTPTGQWMGWCAIAVFLAAPVQGDLRVAAMMLDLFRRLPVAAGQDVARFGGLVTTLVHQSLVLALQLAMPLLALMSLISLAVGWADRRRRSLWPALVPLRIAFSLCFLALGMTALGDALAMRFTELLEATRTLVTHGV